MKIKKGIKNAKQNKQTKHYILYVDAGHVLIAHLTDI